MQIKEIDEIPSFVRGKTAELFDRMKTSNKLELTFDTEQEAAKYASNLSSLRMKRAGFKQRRKGAIIYVWKDETVKKEGNGA